MPMGKSSLSRAAAASCGPASALVRWKLSVRAKREIFTLAALRFLFASLMALCAHYVNGMTKFWLPDRWGRHGGCSSLFAGHGKAAVEQTLIEPVLLQCVAHGNDVLRGDIIDDVVDGVKNKATAGGQDFDVAHARTHGPSFPALGLRSVCEPGGKSEGRAAPHAEDRVRRWCRREPGRADWKTRSGNKPRGSYLALISSTVQLTRIYHLQSNGRLPTSDHFGRILSS